jgi:hypothetical protein
MTKVYEIHTDLDPQTLSAVGLEIYWQWLAFALGSIELGGYKIKHPTGRYAGAITYKKTGTSMVTIAVDESKAPEAGYLEEGHDPYDMKNRFGGRKMKLKRGAEGDWGSKGYGAPNILAGNREIRAKIRNQGFTGYRTVALPGKPGWVIPRMRAYAPAQHLADLFREQYGKR